MQVTKLVVPKDKVVRRRTWLAAGGSFLVATAGLFGAAGPASADGTSPVVGYTYVDDNTAPTNTIAGFDRHADGSLSPIPGSPFPSGGAGLGAGLASQGAIQVTRDGRYLLAVDAGSNQILGAAHHGRRCAGRSSDSQWLRAGPGRSVWRSQQLVWSTSPTRARVAAAIPGSGFTSTAALHRSQDRRSPSPTARA